MEDILLIFDIDGTLTDSAGLSRGAFEMAALDIYGVKESTTGIIPYGKTDRLIFKEMIVNNGWNVTDFEAEFASFKKCYTAHFDRLMQESDMPRAYKGAQEMLLFLSSRPEMYLTIGTGNARECAAIKLAKHGIDRFFRGGGFGDDHDQRIDILAQAYNEACASMGSDFEKHRIWVIGDTPFDVNAGKSLGFRTAGVANGAIGVEELEACSPDLVFKNFHDAEALYQAVMLSYNGGV